VGLHATAESEAVNLDPDIVVAEIVEDLQAALAQFTEIASDLKCATVLDNKIAPDQR